MPDTISLTPEEIRTAMQGGGGTYYLGASQFTYSIPGPGSVWGAYAAGEEPYDSYSVVNAAQAANFELALQMWDELIAPDFTEVADDASGSGELRVAFTAMDPGYAGYAYMGTPRAPGGKVGDVWLNSSLTGETYDPGTQGFATLVHEIGHTLGLKHPFESPALPIEYQNERFTVMAYDAAEQGIITDFYYDSGYLYSSRAYIVVVTPMVIDIAAVQEIYGAETTTRTGDDVYSFSDDDGAVLRTLYDAGGNDTLDLSACLRDCEIDLRPGAYSSVGIWSVADQIAYWQAIYSWAASFIAAQYDADSFEWTDNLGIALSTLIENASGGSGDDSMLGNDVANVLTGNAGDDTLDGGLGADTMVGGLGNDVYVVDSASDIVTENVGEGVDEVRTALGTYALATNVEILTGTSDTGQYLVGNNSSNTINAGAGNDILLGGKGSDTLNGGGGDDYLNGGTGQDTMVGGAGADTYFIKQTGKVVVEAADEGIDRVKALVDHTLADNVETLIMLGSVGLSGTGNGLTNEIRGTAFNDTIDGMGGDDFLRGMDGDDIVQGGAGHDKILGVEGNDELHGGDGDDRLQGWTGQDELYGGAGIDLLEGGSDNDTLDGGADVDRLFGGSGADSLDGGEGNDRLWGDNGSDVLRGGAGWDRIYGGTEADTFVFAEGDTAAARIDADIIFDFSIAEGDTLDLSGIDADAGVDSDQAFTFIGSAAFSGTAGELRYENHNALTWVEGDTDGDGAADFSVRLDGTLSLAEADFVL